jgi:hypothetical protein
VEGLVTGTFLDRATRWQLDIVREKYPGLRLAPSKGDLTRLTGVLRFSAQPHSREKIDDEYEVDILLPAKFPSELARVTETKGRIAVSYGHRNADGTLCLGSPTALRLRILDGSPLLSYIEKCIIPTLYGHSYFERHGVLPFGELKHGVAGLREDLAALFGVDDEVAVDFVRLTALRKRVANKRPCGCGSGRRLGRCHNRRVNMLRRRLQRRWFRRML